MYFESLKDRTQTQFKEIIARNENEARDKIIKSIISTC